MFEIENMISDIVLRAVINYLFIGVYTSNVCLNSCVKCLHDQYRYK